MNSISDITSISWTESFESQSCTDIKSSETDRRIREKSVERFSSKRKKIIVVTVVAVVISIIITMILTITLLKSNNTTNQTSTSTNNSNGYTAPTLAPRAIIYDVGNGGISGDPPCSSYTVINDPSRNINKSGIGGACDNGPLFNTSIGGRWIRFMGKGGTIIPSISPGRQHCSSYLAGWSNVTLPSTTNTSVNGAVCFESTVNICIFKLPTTVVNCGIFYVYFLPPIDFCNARYCTI